MIYGDQTAFVKCSEGFKIEGSPFISCLRTSKWEVSKLPSCKIVKCSPLKTPSNGKLALTKISYSGRAKFTCDDGFSLIGSEKIICMANGNWSDDVPSCASIYQCSALAEPPNGALIYASDSGIIENQLPQYPVGTFAQVQCNEGFSIENENLISCSDQGEWDFDVEDCQANEVAVEEVFEEKTKIPLEFWRDFKQFLFRSCSNNAGGKMCNRFDSEFDSDLSSFELPETKEYEGMDSKLLKLLKNILVSKDFNSINVGNFMKNLLPGNELDIVMRDSYRFVVCLYIDLIVLDDELYESSSENVNENIKKTLKRIALPMFKHQLQLSSRS